MLGLTDVFSFFVECDFLDTLIQGLTISTFLLVVLWALKKWAEFRFEELMSLACDVRSGGEERAKIQRSEEIKNAFATAIKQRNFRGGTCSAYLEIETALAQQSYEKALQLVDSRYDADRRKAVKAYNRRLPLFWRLKPKKGIAISLYTGGIRYF